MIVDSITALIGQYLLVGHNNDELVVLCAIIHDVIIIFRFQQRKYVCNATVIKLDGSKPGEGRLRTDNPCSCIAVDTYEPPICVTYFLQHFLVHNNIQSGMYIYQHPPWTKLFS